MQRQQLASKHLLEGMPQTDPVRTTEDAAAVKSDHAFVEAVDDTKSAEASDNGDASSPEKAPAASAETAGAQTPTQHSYSLRSRAKLAKAKAEKRLEEIEEKNSADSAETADLRARLAAASRVTACASGVSDRRPRLWRVRGQKIQDFAIFLDFQ